MQAEDQVDPRESRDSTSYGEHLVGRILELLAIVRAPAQLPTRYGLRTTTNCARADILLGANRQPTLAGSAESPADVSAEQIGAPPEKGESPWRCDSFQQSFCPLSSHGPQWSFPKEGCLDSTFGSDGKVTTDVTPQADELYALALQPDGKIIAAGTAGRGEPVSSFALVRYNADGSLDSTFGSGGKVTTNFSGNNDAAVAVALRPDGMILVAGVVTFGVAPLLNSDSAVARYLADGTLDTSFGSAGIVTIDFAGRANAALAIVLQPDLKFVTLNTVGGFALDTQWALVRYNPDGSPDGSFGSGGSVVTNIGPSDDRPTALALQPDGKILATGLTFDGLNNQVALLRYESNGILDSTFGSGGIVMTGFLGEDAGGFDVLPLPSGQILVAGGGPGAGSPDFSDFLLLRYNSDGSLDTTFGTGGFVLTDLRGTTDNNSEMAIDASGRIILVGQSFRVVSGSSFAMARFDPDGGLDASFGIGGKVLTDFASPGLEGASDVVIQPDGRIVLGGVVSGPDLRIRPCPLSR